MKMDLHQPYPAGWKDIIRHLMPILKFSSKRCMLSNFSIYWALDYCPKKDVGMIPLLLYFILFVYLIPFKKCNSLATKTLKIKWLCCIIMVYYRFNDLFNHCGTRKLANLNIIILLHNTRLSFQVRKMLVK